MGTSFTGEVSSNRLTSCPGGGEMQLSAKRHGNLRLAPTLWALWSEKDFWSKIGYPCNRCDYHYNNDQLFMLIYSISIKNQVAAFSWWSSFRGESEQARNWRRRSSHSWGGYLCFRVSQPVFNKKVFRVKLSLKRHVH